MRLFVSCSLLVLTTCLAIPASAVSAYREVIELTRAMGNTNCTQSLDSLLSWALAEEREGVVASRFAEITEWFRTDPEFARSAFCSIPAGTALQPSTESGKPASYDLVPDPVRPAPAMDSALEAEPETFSLPQAWSYAPAPRPPEPSISVLTAETQYTDWSVVEKSGQWGLRFFEPKIRVYVDTGTDDEGEVDIFDDGALTATVNLAELRWYWSWERAAYGRKAGEDKYRFYAIEDGKADLWSGDGHPPREKAREISRWSVGLALGAGIGSPANNSEDGMEQASSAPVLLATIGPFVEFDLRDAWGEWFGDTEDNRFAAMKQEAAGVPEALKPKFIAEAGWVFGYSTDEDLSDNDDSALYFGMGFHIPFK